MKKKLLIAPAVAFALLLSGCSIITNAIFPHNSSSSDGGHTTLPSISHSSSSDSSSESSNSSSSASHSSSSSSSSSSHSSSSSSSGSSSSSSSGQTSKDEWTIMIYMCGSNLESDYASSNQGLATMDITEILSVSGQPDNVNIIIETGGATKWSSKYGISASKLERWHVDNKKIVKDASLAKANMGLQSTFQSFVEWGLESYPAERYGIFMWNHGGAMDGCCFDDNYDGDSLSDYEMTDALTAAKKSKGFTGNFDFIAYDACLMAVQDIAELNSHHFDYMLCSQETESGYGYDYDEWLPILYNNPTTVTTEEVLTKIATTFLDEQVSLGAYDQTQSVLDLTKMSAYKSAFDAVADSLTSIVTSSSKWTALANTINKATKYGWYDDSQAQSYNGGYLYDIFDMGECITNLKSAYSSMTSELNDLQTALDNLVVYEGHGSQIKGSGLCLFCPLSGYNLYADSAYYPACYSAKHTNFTSWRNLCVKYGTWYS